MPFITLSHNDGEPPEKVIKLPSKTNNTFNSAMIMMMASFLPVMLDKKNKQTENNMPAITVSHYDGEPPEKVIKVPSKTNNTFNSAVILMMASFLPVIVNKKNKQTKKNMPFITVSHKFTLILNKI